MSRTSELNQALIELQEELTTLKSLTEYISDTKNSAASAIENTAKTLENVESLFRDFSQDSKDVVKKSVTKIEKDSKILIAKSSESLTDAEVQFKKNIETTQDALSRFIKSQHSITKAITKDAKVLSKSSQELVDSTSTLLIKIDSVDFPSRLDKLDIAISSLNTGIQNLQGRIDIFETNNNKNLDNKVNLVEKNINNTINSKISHLSDRMEKIHKISVSVMVAGLLGIAGYVFYTTIGLTRDIGNILQLVGG